MTAGLTFKKQDGGAAANLSEVNTIILEDKTGNKYTLDLEGEELKLKYEPKTGDKIEHTVDGLVKALGGLFNVKNGTKTVLAEEVANKDVVKAIFSVKEQPADTQSILATKVADKDVVKAIFGAKEQPADTQSILATKVADKNVAGAILGAKEGQKSVLVEKLETFLGEGHKVYSNNTKTAKELLVPSAGDLLKDPGFKSGIDKSIKDMAVAENSDFQKAVRGVMSKPVFEIPTDENEPLSWDWI